MPLLDHLKRHEELEEQSQDTGGNHRQAVVDHMELVERALAGEREYLSRLAQMRQTSPMGHDPSEPIPAKDNG